ncbi:MAG: hypothetical protein IJX44_08455 [Bacteroidaceae bacterium]|nr:hypothetical protein [Bacteroidaceae bacterium]
MERYRALSSFSSLSMHHRLLDVCLCQCYGRRLPSLWQIYAIVMADVCQRRWQ